MTVGGNVSERTIHTKDRIETTSVSHSRGEGDKRQPGEGQCGAEKRRGVYNS